MTPKQLKKYEKLLLSERERILNNTQRAMKSDQLSVSTDDLADETDLASVDLSKDVMFSLREKERQMILKIDDALEKIEDGSYGECDDCGEPIGEKRLEVFPTATLCIQHQEEAEHKAKTYKANIA